MVSHYYHQINHYLCLLNDIFGECHMKTHILPHLITDMHGWGCGTIYSVRQVYANSMHYENKQNQSKQWLGAAIFNMTIFFLIYCSNIIQFHGNSTHTEYVLWFVNKCCVSSTGPEPNVWINTIATRPYCMNGWWGRNSNPEATIEIHFRYFESNKKLIESNIVSGLHCTLSSIDFITYIFDCFFASNLFGEKFCDWSIIYPHSCKYLLTIFVIIKLTIRSFFSLK